MICVWFLVCYCIYMYNLFSASKHAVILYNGSILIGKLFLFRSYSIYTPLFKINGFRLTY